LRPLRPSAQPPTTARPACGRLVAMFHAIYDRLFAALYDIVMGRSERAGLRERRAELLAGASGDVLEIGAGSGANADFYDPLYDSLTLSEPSDPMADKLEDTLRKKGVRAALIRAGAESMPLDDQSMDTVISALVLCTVPDVNASLAEIHRVLRPGGRLLFLEHVRAADPKKARWQDRFAKPWEIFANGCRCNRDTEAAIRGAGFEITTIDRGETPKAPPIVRPLIWGEAVRA
ncbi:MAG: class I SAM-dependent methyltransferase, partial [Solirubrobacterales bacterium]